MNWRRISLLLCVFGFLKGFRPSDPFIYEYLIGPWKNFTRNQVYQEVWPYTTYSQFAFLFPVLLLTDFLRYKPIVILCGVAGSCAQLTLLLAHSLWVLQVSKLMTGLFLSTEVAYFSYVYVKVDKQHYQEVTSHLRMALLLGGFVSYVTSQFFVSFELLDYQHLNYMTLLGITAGTIWTFFLPAVRESIYIHRKTICDSDENSPPKVEDGMIKLKRRSADQLYYSQLAVDPENHVNQNTSPTLGVKIKNAFNELRKDFLLSYSQSHVLKWSMWWACSMCGWRLVISYIQILWETSFTGSDSVYNAGVGAGQMILSTLATFGVGKLKLNWMIIGEAVLAVFAMIQGVLLFVSAKTFNIWISYATYIGFSVIHNCMLTVADSEVAKNLPKNRYGLIFGLNMFMALILQSIFTFIFVGSWGFAFTIRSQYLVLGSYYVMLGAIFMVMALYTIVKQCRSNEQFHIWEPPLPSL